MITRISTAAICSSILLLLASAGVAWSKVYVLDLDETSPAGKLSVRAVPAKPSSMVSDEGNELSETVLTATEAGLNTQLAPVYLVVSANELPEGIQPPVFANELLRRWNKGKAPFAAIVFTLPRPLASIHIALAGRGLSADETSKLRELGNQALAKMPSQAPFAEAAAVAATDLHYSLSTLQREMAPPVAEAALEAAAPATSAIATSSATAPPSQPAPSSHWEALSRKLDWNKIRLASSIVGGFLVAVCTFFLLRRVKNRRGQLFPEHLPRKRFSAPFGGGSNAQIDYGDVT